MLKLYATDYCPFCWKVRNAFKDMGIEYEFIPSDPGTAGGEELLKLGGKAQTPFLVDTERGVQMYESDDIIAYGREHYSS